MKKRGFTLIELIGVVSILGIILVVALPQIGNTLKRQAEQKFDTVLKDLYLAAEQYAWNHRESFPVLEQVGGEAMVTLRALRNVGYVRENLENPITKKRFFDTDYILVYVNPDKTRRYTFNTGVPDITVEGNTNTWTANKTLKIVVNSNDELANNPYSFDGGTTWQSSNTKVFTKNQTVNVWVKDSNGGIQKKTVNITKIDDTYPSDITLTATGITTNGMTINVSATQNKMGIRGYQFKMDGSAYASEQATSIKTFSGLTRNTSHTFQVKVIGKNGLSKESSVLTVKTNNIPTPAYSVSPGATTWSTAKTVTIDYLQNKPSNLIYEYSTNGGSTWTAVTTRTKAVSFTANGSIIARVRDTGSSSNTVTASTFTVTKIDRIAPTCTTSGGNTSWTEGNVTIYGTCKDSGGSGCANISRTISTDYNGAASPGVVTDGAGNKTTCPNTNVYIDKGAPTYSYAEYKNVTSTGYDAYIYGVTDNGSGVDLVKFPSWTQLGGQDDIEWAVGTNLGGGTWKYHVNIGNHYNEGGRYITHIYLYDKLGKSRGMSFGVTYVPQANLVGSAYTDGNETFNGTRSIGIGPNQYVNATYEFDASPNRNISMASIGERLFDNTRMWSMVNNWIFPEDHGGAASNGRAGIGLSIGNNGAIMVAHRDGYYTCLLSYTANLSGQHKYRVVIQNNVPYLYIDNRLVASGIAPGDGIAQLYFGGSVGYGAYNGNFIGTANSFHLYNNARR